jgi:hypothetical protein
MTISKRALHIAKHGSIRYMREAAKCPINSSALSRRFTAFGSTPINSNILFCPREPTLRDFGEDEQNTVAGVGMFFNHAGQFTLLTFPEPVKNPASSVSYILIFNFVYILFKEFRMYRTRLILLKMILKHFGFPAIISPSGDLRVNFTTTRVDNVRRFYNFVTIVVRQDPDHSDVPSEIIDNSWPFEDYEDNEPRVPSLFTIDNQKGSKMNSTFFSLQRYIFNQYIFAIMRLVR